MDFFGPASSKLEDILEWILFWAGLVLSFLGFIGIIIMIFSGRKIMLDKVLLNAFTFISFYMLFFGLFLLAYRKKIIVKPKVQE